MSIEDKLQLLGIQEVTTDRQKSNGTREFELPIKDSWSGKKIRVASFKTGYVRNQNSGYSNYQLNKRCQSEPRYFKLSNGDYRKFETRSCVLIPKEIDRLEYLIKYCVKNYYIKNANQVANGKFVPEWMYDNACKNGHDMLHEQKQYENQRVQAVKDRHKAQLEELITYKDEYRNRSSEINKMNAKQEQLINKIERIKTFLTHELL